MSDRPEPTSVPVFPLEQIPVSVAIGHAEIDQERFRRVFHRTMDRLIEEDLVPADRSTSELIEAVQPHVMTAVSVALALVDEEDASAVARRIYDSLQGLLAHLT